MNTTALPARPRTGRRIDLGAFNPVTDDGPPLPWWSEPDVAPELLSGPRPEWMTAADWAKFREHFADVIRAEVHADRPSWMSAGQWRTVRARLLADLIAERHQPADDESGRPPLEVPQGVNWRVLSDDELSVRRRRRALCDSLDIPGAGRHRHRRTA